MLQPFVRVCHITMLRHIGLKEIFRFFNFPDAEPCCIVDLMLKKYWHKWDLRFEIADFRYKIAF